MKTRFALGIIASVILAVSFGRGEDQFKRRRPSSDAIMRTFSADTSRDTSWVSLIYEIGQIGVEIPWSHGDSILAKFDWKTRGLTCCGIWIGRQFPYDTTWTYHNVDSDTAPTFSHTFQIYLNSHYPYRAKVSARLANADSMRYDPRPTVGAISGKSNCELVVYDSIKCRTTDSSVAVALFPHYFPYCHAAIRVALVSAPTVFLYGFDLNQLADSLDGAHITIQGLLADTTYFTEWMGWLAGCSLPVELEDYGWSVSLGTFTTEESAPACPTVVQSDFASQAITATALGSFHLHTDYACGVAIRYKKAGGAYGAPTYVDADADSLTHTITGPTGLDPATLHYWQAKTHYAGCDSSGWGTAQSFTTSCPTVTQSNFAAQEITSSGATFHVHFDYAVGAAVRWKKTGGAWATVNGIGEDSVQATYNFPVVFDPAQEYKWQVKTKYTGCDSSAWGAEQTFTTLCPPNNAFASAATQHIGPTYATLHVHTEGRDTHVDFRYHTSPSGAWVYGTHDIDADSSMHTVTITGLTNTTSYTWGARITYNGGSASCDPLGWDSLASFSTACPTVAKTGIGTKAIAPDGATLTFTSDYTVHGGFRYSKVTPESWVYRHDADADSLGSHTVTIGGLSQLTDYKWQLMTYHAGCVADTTYGNQQTFQTLFEE